MQSSSYSGITQVESTPNPNAYKFYMDRQLLHSGAYQLTKGEKSGVIFLDQLIALTYIESIYVGFEFITIQKNPSIEWYEVVDIVKRLAAKYLPQSDWSALIPNCNSAAEFGEISEYFTHVILPATEKDGGGIFLKNYEPSSGLIEVQIRGACQGCPHTRETLLKGILGPLHRKKIGIKSLREV
jgi:Fe-S cluster biogenesis protein NfuA